MIAMDGHECERDRHASKQKRKRESKREERGERERERERENVKQRETLANRRRIARRMEILQPERWRTEDFINVRRRKVLRLEDEGHTAE